MILDLDRLGLIDYDKPFNEDAKFCCYKFDEYERNRKSNAIRGAITEDTKILVNYSSLRRRNKQSIS